MKYKIEGEVDIPKEECESFEYSNKQKLFDFFRFLADNSAKIKIKKMKK